MCSSCFSWEKNNTKTKAPGTKSNSIAMGIVKIAAWGTSSNPPVKGISLFFSVHRLKKHCLFPFLLFSKICSSSFPLLSLLLLCRGVGQTGFRNLQALLQLSLGGRGKLSRSNSQHVKREAQTGCHSIHFYYHIDCFKNLIRDSEGLSD